MSNLLSVSGVGKCFGMLKAVDDVSFDIQPGSVIGLIGPNGAGKSTLYNLLAGAFPVSSGSIVYNGTDITMLSSHRRAAIGIARTFQIAKPFRNMTVEDNVIVGLLRTNKKLADAREKAGRILEQTLLDSVAQVKTSLLTTGQLKRLEVARALSVQPKLVLFDEIMAGLTANEIDEISLLIKKLPEQGVTVLWVEHMLKTLMATVDRVLVMDRGKLIADGSPEKITRDETVIEAYLGKSVSNA